MTGRFLGLLSLGAILFIATYSFSTQTASAQVNAGGACPATGVYIAGAPYGELDANNKSGCVSSAAYLGSSLASAVVAAEGAQPCVKFNNYGRTCNASGILKNGFCKGPGDCSGRNAQTQCDDNGKWGSCNPTPLPKTTGSCADGLTGTNCNSALEGQNEPDEKAPANNTPPPQNIPPPSNAPAADTANVGKSTVTNDTSANSTADQTVPPINPQAGTPSFAPLTNDAGQSLTPSTGLSGGTPLPNQALGAQPYTYGVPGVFSPPAQSDTSGGQNSAGVSTETFAPNANTDTASGEAGTPSQDSQCGTACTAVKDAFQTALGTTGTITNGLCGISSYCTGIKDGLTYLYNNFGLSLTWDGAVPGGTDQITIVPTLGNLPLGVNFTQSPDLNGLTPGITVQPNGVIVPIDTVNNANGTPPITLASLQGPNVSPFSYTGAGEALQTGNNGALGVNTNTAGPLTAGSLNTITGAGQNGVNANTSGNGGYVPTVNGAGQNLAQPVTVTGNGAGVSTAPTQQFQGGPTTQVGPNNTVPAYQSVAPTSVTGQQTAPSVTSSGPTAVGPSGVNSQGSPVTPGASYQPYTPLSGTSDSGYPQTVSALPTATQPFGYNIAPINPAALSAQPGQVAGQIGSAQITPGQVPVTAAVSPFHVAPVTIGSLAPALAPQTNQNILVLAGIQLSLPANNLITALTSGNTATNNETSSASPQNPSAEPTDLGTAVQLSSGTGEETSPSDILAGLSALSNNDAGYTAQYLDTETQLAQAKSSDQEVQAELGALQEFENAGLCDNDCVQNLATLQSQTTSDQDQINKIQTTLDQLQGVSANSSPSDIIAAVANQPVYQNSATAMVNTLTGGTTPVTTSHLYEAAPETGYTAPNAAPELNVPTTLPAQNIQPYQPPQPTQSVFSPLTSVWNSFVSLLAPAASSVSSPPSTSCSLFSSLFGGCSGW